MFETPEDRLSEIELYALVADELEKGTQSKGLWAKALAEGEGNLERARGLYIKLRVKMVQDEWAAAGKLKELEEARVRKFNETTHQQNRKARSKEKAREYGRWTIGTALAWLGMATLNLAVGFYSNFEYVLIPLYLWETVRLSIIIPIVLFVCWVWLRLRS